MEAVLVDLQGAEVSDGKQRADKEQEMYVKGWQHRGGLRQPEVCTMPSAEETQGQGLCAWRIHP